MYAVRMEYDKNSFPLDVKIKMRMDFIEKFGTHHIITLIFAIKIEK